MERKASAVWKGGLKDGKGTISAPGGVLKDTQYSFTSRFENGPGTNPEELIAAAHAACFSMALSAQLGGANLSAGQHQHERDADHGEAGLRVDDYIEPHRCGGEGSGSGCGRVSEICGSGGEGLSGVEGAEREDFDDGEAGISRGAYRNVFHHRGTETQRSENNDVIFLRVSVVRRFV